MQYEVHPLAELLRPLTDAEFSNLSEDIRLNGLRVPIVLYQGKILDGVNRAKACEKWGVHLRTETLPKGEHPGRAVLSYNAKRRQMSPSQLAELVNRPEFRERIAAEAAGRVGGDRPSGSRDPDAGKTNARLAEIVGIGEATVRRAAAVEKHDREHKTGAMKRIHTGESTVNTEYDKIKGKQQAKPQSTKPITAKAFSTQITRVFDALGGLNAALELLDLEAGKLEVSRTEHERFLETALAFQRRIKILIAKLRGKQS